MAPADGSMLDRRVILAGLAVVAIAVPALLAFNTPPSATFLNQAASFVGWGAWLVTLTGALQARCKGGQRSGLTALIAALGVLILAALISPLWTGLPTTLSLSSAGLVAAAVLSAASASATQRAGHGRAAFEAFCTGLLVAGVLSSFIGIAQMFAPEGTFGALIAQSSAEGRAVGNLRQPNHLSSLLLWSMIALVWLGDARQLARWATGALMALMLFGVVLSGSRTGMLGTLLLAFWGVVDRRLSRTARITLWLLPLLYVLFWAGVREWAHLHEQVFIGEAQLHKADISSSRFAIWRDTLALIAAHPWFGVGWGEFNFAWSLTPFPNRPVAFFDHTHSLPLQFAVELGLPLATLVLALLGWALWAAFCAARDAVDEAPQRRAALAMVVMILVHSLLEYPLWYAYFLLPAAFAFGLCLGVPASAAAVEPVASAAPGRRIRPLMIGALLLLIGGVASVVDYWRVVVIFAPPEGSAPLAERVQAGRHSWFFGHHADYAAATVAPHPGQVLSAFETAPHYLLDTRLMTAWANALNEAGDVDRARHLAQRLREFRNPQSEEFFAPCKTPPKDGAPAPFQCQAPLRRYDYRDFR